MNPEEKRNLLVRRKAREFANLVKSSNMAVKVSDELIDWLRDSDLPLFWLHLEQFGLVQRKDFYWEKKNG